MATEEREMVARPKPDYDLQAHEFCGRAKASASYIRLELARVESVLRLLTHELDELMTHYPKDTQEPVQ